MSCLWWAVLCELSVVSCPLWVAHGELSVVSSLCWAVLCELSVVSCLWWAVWWAVCCELSVVSCLCWVCLCWVTVRLLLFTFCLFVPAVSKLGTGGWGGGEEGGSILESLCLLLCPVLSVYVFSLFSEDIFRSAQPFVLKLCVVVHQRGAECCPRNWDAVVKVKVTVKAHVIKAWLFQSYLSNCWSFWNQT